MLDLPGGHLLPSSVTMSMPLKRLSRNSWMLLVSGRRPDNPAERHKIQMFSRVVILALTVYQYYSNMA